MLEVKFFYLTPEGPLDIAQSVVGRTLDMELQKLNAREVNVLLEQRRTVPCVLAVVSYVPSQAA